MSLRPLFLSALALSAGVGVFQFFSDQTRLASGLSILTFIAILWLTEAIHITATALLVPVAAALLGLMSVGEAFSSFANPIIFLFLGGFALAAAMRQHSLDQWLALLVIKWSRGNLRIAVLLLFVVTAWTSMWISNTATAVMMLPIALGLLAKLDWDKHPGTFVFVLLGVAYSANIGGVGTLVGSPPNAIAASIMGLDFVSWMQLGLPMVLVLLPSALLLLWLILRPQWPVSHETMTEELPRHMNIWTPQARGVLLVFFSVVTLWLLSKPLSQWLGIAKGFDALVAMMGAVVLLAARLLDWKQFEQNTEWGVLLLFGGGIALSGVLSQTGASEYLAQQLVDTIAGMPALLFLAIAVGLMIFLTEISSNTASAALLIPIFYSLPEAQIGLSPMLLSLSIALAASCAFMLPVATPPNAIVFGTGLIQQQQMMRVGLVLNITCVALITLFVPLLAPGN